MNIYYFFIYSSLLRTESRTPLWLPAMLTTTPVVRVTVKKLLIDKSFQNDGKPGNVSIWLTKIEKLSFIKHFFDNPFE